MKTIFKEKKEENKKLGRTKTEIYSRVVGYLRPVNQWNKGKRQEFQDRTNFKQKTKKMG